MRDFVLGSDCFVLFDVHEGESDEKCTHCCWCFVCCTIISSDINGIKKNFLVSNSEQNVRLKSHKRSHSHKISLARVENFPHHVTKTTKISWSSQKESTFHTLSLYFGPFISYNRFPFVHASPIVVKGGEKNHKTNHSCSVLYLVWSVNASASHCHRRWNLNSRLSHFVSFHLTATCQQYEKKIGTF